MPVSAAIVPADTDVLCESCGYTLNGLPNEGNCPECGQPVADSTLRSGRAPSPWESDGRLIHTTIAVTFRPSTFYRSLKTRVGRAQLQAATQFALIHWTLAAVIVAVAVVGHYSPTGVLQWSPGLPAAAGWAATGIVTAGAFLVTAWGLTELATRLTVWEASWRGYRLPLPVVRRALHYHAAQTLPATLALLAVVAGYRTLLAAGLLDFATTIVPYLYVLSATAIGAALHLFWTYWIGMRNLLYANE